MKASSPMKATSIFATMASVEKRVPVLASGWNVSC